MEKALTQATEYYLQNVLKYVSAPPVFEITQDLLQDIQRGKRRDSTVRSLKYFFDKINDELGGKKISEISREDLESICLEETVSPRICKNRIRMVSQLYNHAIKRGWAQENLAATITIPAQDEEEAAIFTVAQAGKVLDAAG